MALQQDPLKLDSMLCFAVYAAGHAFTRFYKPRLDGLGLTYPQYLVFLVLWEADGLTVKGLGDKLFLDSGTITPLVKRLEGRGLVRRERDENDERQVRVFLTTEGRALREKALAIPLAVGAALDGEREAIDTLRDGLHRLRERLDGDLGV
ncbi:MarR family transcriptional regulator [Devosia sp. J2-20]|jgi:MarR family transcriptional regulator, organic hydroperoxide resistance regulator|uniref:MarR family transcriptional regulator n=1 Tax=Devosia litorisediminis TaxID=2829817 RepID=A0A942E807_9HYPH|nr:MULTISPECIES: MarR family transcriptional regulator [Devosia]MBS3847529.1 MarR family transcriptional regulator [Devosia litorisediminis]MCZ4347110.1 MarR family transcriptional regulator [Devosia neptuniae]WDQ99351.1 MarR family transcriptional regulator [Devosia sp. J2-20]|tara:strand:- start:6793 stop:7242 length:450 start_codon:yes stop_codon:yes gene_type:complete